METSSTQRFILVTGGLGYIGSHTVVEILKRGNNVIIIDNCTNSYEHVFTRIQAMVEQYYAVHKPAGTPLPLARHIAVDYRDQLAMRAVLDTYAHDAQITGVIHFAASKSVPESIAKPLMYYSNNVGGLVDFVSLLGEYGIYSFVFSSSAAVYGGLADRFAELSEELVVHQQETYVDDYGVMKVVEPMSVGLACPYARTKHMSEAILADLAASDPSWNIIALRYFNPISCDESGVLGERARGVPTNLLPVVTSVLTGEKPSFNVFGSDYDTSDGTAVRDFIHVSDLALGHMAALDALSEGRVKSQFRTYNLGSSTGHSVLAVVDAMEKASGKQIAYKKVPRRAGDLPSCVARNTRASKELHWTPKKTLDMCAEDLCHYLVKNGLLVR